MKNLPGKIWLSEDRTMWIHNPYSTEYTEYVSKDAFIEKACEFIRKGGKRGDAYIVTEFGEEVFDFIQFAEDFKNYLKGEYSHEIIY